MRLADPCPAHLHARPVGQAGSLHVRRHRQPREPLRGRLQRKFLVHAVRHDQGGAEGPHRVGNVRGVEDDLRLKAGAGRVW